MTHFVLCTIVDEKHILPEFKCIYKGTREGAMNAYRMQLAVMKRKGVNHKNGFTSFADDFDSSLESGVMYDSCENERGSKMTIYFGNNNDFRGLLP